MKLTSTKGQCAAIALGPNIVMWIKFSLNGYYLDQTKHIFLFQRSWDRTYFDFGDQEESILEMSPHST